MDDQGTGQTGPRELVFCHSCNDEWYRDEHGLQCPVCESFIVEIIEPDNDPREEMLEHMHDNHEEHDHSHHQDPGDLLHDHNPWGGGTNHDEDVPDPGEGDISHVEWSGPGGVHITRTTYHSNIPRDGESGFGNNMNFDVFVPMLQSLLGPMGGPAPQVQQEGSTGGGTHGQQHPEDRQPGGEGPRSPLQEGPPPSGGIPPATGNVRVTTAGFGPGGLHSHTRQMPANDLVGIFEHILNGINPGNVDHNDMAVPDGDRHPLHLLQHIINPANARRGDAVFTNEALDRVISQLMEQHSVSTAPGPASAAAIAALPNITITKENLDNEDKAECSICMDGVELGTEVTELPCNHWFHGECVSAWLREHDTCPQCRRGIMPKDGDGSRPRQTGQPPQFWNVSENDFRPASSQAQRDGAGNTTPDRAGPSGSGTASSPSDIPSSPTRSSPSSSSPTNRRRDEGSRGFGSGIAGWMGRLRHGSGGDHNDNAR